MKNDDPNVVAHDTLSTILEREEMRREIMREMGRRGGLSGGKAAAAAMTKEERIERARKAGSAPKKARKPE
ncbi:MAG TPA: hypothetical protein VJZ00_23490 [Thermoanaerobaculia bacterium]|nr:hypothetical protein [Thermoanaerobaculia bacterium]